MRLNSGFRLGLFGIIAIAVSGCATYPISKTLRQEARPVTLGQVLESPDTYRGTTVIWGGSIIKTDNDTNGSAIYILKLPLSQGEIPERHAVSTGRFIAQSSRFSDPEVFKRGRLITVAGQIAGVRNEPLQKVRYAYPVMQAREIHLWYPPPRHYPYPAWYWGWYGPGLGWSMYGPGPGWGWYGPGWGWGWNGPDRDWDWE